jgi:hypothetical protein
MLRCITCKDEFTPRLRKSKEVLGQYTLNFPGIFLALANNFLALRETHPRERKQHRFCPRGCGQKSLLTLRSVTLTPSVIHAVATAASGVSPWNTVVARTKTFTVISLKARSLLN